MPRRSLVPVLAAALLAVAGCENPFESEPTPVPGPRAHVLHDFRTGPLVEPSAFDVFSARPVRTDQGSGWDFVFYVTDEGDPQFRPRRVVVQDGSTAGLQRVDETFEDLLKAPGGGYTTDAPVPVDSGSVYAARSRRSGGCSHFGKLSVDSLSSDGARVHVTALSNPNCNERSVEPAETADDEGS